MAEARAYWDATGAATDVARSARCRWAVVPLTASLVRQTAALAATCLADRGPLTVAARLSTRARGAAAVHTPLCLPPARGPRELFLGRRRRGGAGPPRLRLLAQRTAAAGRRRPGDAVVARLGAAAWPLLRLRNRLAALFGGRLDDAGRIYAALYVHWSTTATRGDEPILQLALSGVADSAGGVNAAAVFARRRRGSARGARVAGWHPLRLHARDRRSVAVRRAALGLRPVAQLRRAAPPSSKRPQRGFFAAGGSGGSASSTTPSTRARASFSARRRSARRHAADAAWDFVVASGGDPARAEALAVLGAAFWDRQRTLAADFDAARDPDRTTILALRVTVGAAPTVVARRSRRAHVCGRARRHRGAPPRRAPRVAWPRRRHPAPRRARRFTTPAGATRVVARAVDTALSAYARAGFVAAADDPTCPYLRLRPGETWVVAPLSGGGATERACERSVLT